jgi:hypothetical protein
MDAIHDRYHQEDKIENDEIMVFIPGITGNSQHDAEIEQFRNLASTLGLSLRDIKLVGVTVNGERINGAVPLDIVSPGSLKGRILNSPILNAGAITLPWGITMIQGQFNYKTIMEESFHWWDASKHLGYYGRYVNEWAEGIAYYSVLW